MPQIDRKPAPQHPFSPYLASPEQLERTLVGRDVLINDILQSITNISEKSSANHFFLVGPRGIGKTHLLALLNHYLGGRLGVPTEASGLPEKWIPVFFTEEEYTKQNSLANFFLSVMESLHSRYPAEPFLILPEDIMSKDDATICDCCIERISEFHDKTRKGIVLLVDNFQKTIQSWTEDEHWRLRKFLSGKSFVVMIASSPMVFKKLLGEQDPFHEFFEIRELKQLNTAQVMELLCKKFREDGREKEFLERKTELENKVRAIEILTGGNPRLITFLYQIAAKSSFFEIETAIHELIEDLREFFMSRFNELPDQPRKVLDTLAQMPGPATPTEIAAAARLPVATVNAQLTRLKKTSYVYAQKFKKQKATVYDITERLFRIWRQTSTVAGRQRFRFLVDFLKIYYTPDELREIFSSHIGELQNIGENKVSETGTEYFSATRVLVLGRHLRDILDTRPLSFLEELWQVLPSINDDAARKILDPFIKAEELIRTKDVGVLERLFPEVREIVLDIVKKIDPELAETIYRKIPHNASTA